MELVWREEFDDNGTSTPDSSSWNVRTGNWRPGTQVYGPAGVRLVRAEGMSTHLAVTASRSSVGFTSGRLDTRGLREFSPPVVVMASIQMPTGAQGVVPALWTLGSNPADPDNWPECGEIDLVEWQSDHPVNLGVRLGRACAQTVHGPRRESPASDLPLGHTTVFPLDLSIGFHTYALWWLPDQVWFTLDGVETFRVTRGEYEAAGGDWTPLSGAWPHHLVVNVAVDTGMTPDATTDSPFPVSMLIDWVRVYRVDAGVSGPGG